MTLKQLRDKCEQQTIGFAVAVPKLLHFANSGPFDFAQDRQARMTQNVAI